MRPDVTVLTKNNMGSIDRCMSAVRENIPLHRLICIDNGSTDGTIDIVKSYADELHLRPGLSIGQMRYLQAKLCSTDWIAYIDSDLYVFENWWEVLSTYLDKGSPFVVGRMKLFSSVPIYEEWWEHQCDLYGMYSIANTMVRREMMLDARPFIDRREARIADFRIMNYLRHAGLRPLLTRQVVSFHDQDIAKKHPRQNYQLGRDWAAQSFPLPLFHFAVNMADTFVKFASFCAYKRRFEWPLLAYLMRHYITPTFDGYLRSV